jgi:predicted PurR-regulated permease PerM
MAARWRAGSARLGSDSLIVLVIPDRARNIERESKVVNVSLKAEGFETPRPTIYDTVSWILMATALFLVLLLHLLPALLVGLATYELVRLLVQFLKIVKIHHIRAKLAAVGVVALGVVTFIILATLSVISFLQTDNIPMLLSKLADSLQSWREVLPTAVAEQLPASPEDLRQMVIAWLPLHVGELKQAGAEAVRVIAHIFFGLALGVLASLHEVKPHEPPKPLARALTARVERLGEAFRRVVFAQVRIAALNSVLTALYLLVILPSLDVHLPLVKTMIGFTFLVGLLPVVGNLISNVAIVILSLSESVPVAVASLVFLVVIHKLEYFLNAHLIGTQIHAHAWELLLAMLVMEAAFGLPGLVAAPIYYAYAKDELGTQELV